MPAGPGDAGAANRRDAGRGRLLLGPGRRPLRRRHAADRRAAHGPAARGRDARHPGLVAHELEGLIRRAPEQWHVLEDRVRGDVSAASRFVSPYALSVFGGVQEQVLAMSRELGAPRPRRPGRRPRRPRRRVATTPRRASCASGAVVALPANGSTRAAHVVAARVARAARRAVARLRRPTSCTSTSPSPRCLGWAIAARARARRPSRRSTAAATGPAMSLTAPLLRRCARHLDVARRGERTRPPTRRARLRRDARPSSSTDSRSSASCEFARERHDGVTILVSSGASRSARASPSRSTRCVAHNATSAPTVAPGDRRRRARARGDLDALAAGDARDRLRRRGDRRREAPVASPRRRRWSRPRTHGESFGLVLLEAMASETARRGERHPGLPRGGRATHAVFSCPGDAVALERAASTRRWSQRRRRARPARASYAERWSMRSTDGPLRGALRVGRRAFTPPAVALSHGNQATIAIAALARRRGTAARATSRRCSIPTWQNPYAPSRGRAPRPPRRRARLRAAPATARGPSPSGVVVARPDRRRRRRSVAARRRRGRSRWLYALDLRRALVRYDERRGRTLGAGVLARVHRRRAPSTDRQRLVDGARPTDRDLRRRRA